MNDEIVIVAAKRTAIGRFNGSLADFTGRDLAAFAIKGVIENAVKKSNGGFSQDMINYVRFGSCMERCDQLNVTRVACLQAGLSNTICASTINQVCTSAMQATVDAIMLIRGNPDIDIMLVGGVESMSNTTFQSFEARRGCGYGNKTFFDSLYMGLHAGGRIIMGLTAENLAEKYNITREEQDEVALRSHNNAENATNEGLFKEEIVPISIPQKKKEPIIFDKDEHFRPGQTMEQLASLPPAFKKDGTVTAGNSSGINDGAAAILLMRKSKAEELGFQPLATFINWGIGGCDPDYMGESPVPAVKQVLNRANLQLSDLELIELNEAFAAQYLTCEKLLDLNRDITNVVGSGIGLGHPVGCTGVRLIVTLLHQMIQRNLSLGMASLCGGGGIGMATIWKRE